MAGKRKSEVRSQKSENGGAWVRTWVTRVVQDIGNTSGLLLMFRCLVFVCGLFLVSGSGSRFDGTSALTRDECFGLRFNGPHQQLGEVDLPAAIALSF